MKVSGMACTNCNGGLGLNPLDLVTAFVGAGSGGSGGGGASASPGAPSSITVSPAMQQAFNPQFSPVMQQSSGSGSQTATPTQHSSGGQAATTGQPGPDGGMTPYGSPFSSPVSPFADPFAAPVAQSTNTYTPLLITGIVAVAALVGYSMYAKKSARRS